MRYQFIIALLIISASTYAQVQVGSDTTLVGKDSTVIRSLGESGPTIEITSKAPLHDPARAALLSAVIPGLGQAYNKKYWKIPIVWVGLGAFAYFIRWNDDNYQFYRKNLIYEIEQNPDYPNETDLDQASLKSARDNFRRSRDQLAIFGILFYAVQIVDAHVDAHLIEFDVNQDLSVRFEPSYLPAKGGASQLGLSLKFRFKP